MPTFEELGFKADPLWFGQNRPFPTPIWNRGFKPRKTIVLDQGLNERLYTIKEWPTLKPSSSKSDTYQSQEKKTIYLNLPNSISKLAFSNVCVASPSCTGGLFINTP